MGKKIEAPINKAYRLLSESRYTDKISKKTNQIKNDPQFKKELRIMHKKHPLPEGQKELDAYCNKVIRRARKGFIKNKSKSKYVVFQEWKEFCHKWGISWNVYFPSREIKAKATIRIGGNREYQILMAPVSADVTEQDILDYAPVLAYFKNALLGKAKTDQGRNSNAEIYIKMRKEYLKRRKDGENAVKIKKDISSAYGYKFSTTDRIVHTLKYS